MNIEQEREAFEAACIKHAEEAGYDEEAVILTRNGDEYVYKLTRAAWWGYQAGRAALQSQDREDAERYRWLRDGGNDGMGVVRGFDCIDCGSTTVAGTYEEGLEGEQLDAAIDHARRIEGEVSDSE